MVDLETYNLIYIRKSDKRKFLGKLITKLQRKLIDSVTGEVIDLTEYKLVKYYRPDKKTNRRNISQRINRYGRNKKAA